MRPDGYDAPVTDLVRVERGGPNDAVARVTLDRPDVHNAFNAALIDELRQAHQRLLLEFRSFPQINLKIQNLIFLER